jgi:hypothetical protein
MSLNRALKREETRQSTKHIGIPSVRVPPKDVIHAMRNDCRKAQKLNLLVARLWHWDDWAEMSMEVTDITRI